MESPAKKSANKWLLGLGIGCGGLVVLGIIIGIFGYFFVRNMSQGFRDSQGMMKTLEDKYGRAEAYVPDPHGAIGADRIETFLAVREAAAPARTGLEESLGVLAKAQKEREAQGGSARNAFQAVRTGLQMVPQMADFMKARAEALLAKDMGIGEYDYLYMIIYYSWLKRPPEDGPGVEFRSGEFGGANRGSQDALEMSRDLTLRRVHRTGLPMLENQLARFKASPGGGGGPAAEKWAAALEAEVKAMAADRFRIPWQDGLPDTLERPLRPFRERLEAAYSRMTNPFELGLERR
jgi:hypothetical protein